MPFETHTKNGLVWLTSPMLEGVAHGFSTRQGGVSAPPWDTLNLGPSRGDDPSAVAENYRRFCGAVGIEPARMVMSHQVHETTVRLCTSVDCGKGLDRERDYTADALVTNEPDLPLVVFSADCGLILLHDPVRRAIGAVHAGWRGCAAGIVEKTVQTMTETFGSDPTHIRAALGPCIGKCCFETDWDVPQAMLDALGPKALTAIRQKGEKYYVDNKFCNALWLQRAGIGGLDISPDCTRCQPQRYWSHRATNGLRGSLAGIIMLK